MTNIKVNHSLKMCIAVLVVVAMAWTLFLKGASVASAWEDGGDNNPEPNVTSGAISGASSSLGAQANGDNGGANGNASASSAQGIEALASEIGAGQGTQTSPLLIDSAESLEKLSEVYTNADGNGIDNPLAVEVFGEEAVSEGKTDADVYVQVADNIDFGGSGVTPIGTEDHPFTSHFDGNGKTFSHYQIQEKNNFAGLFGKVKDATISRLFMDDVSSYDYTEEGEQQFYIGALAAFIDGDSTISQVGVNGTLEYGELDNDEIFSALGGIVGFANANTIITNSYSQVDLIVDDLVVGDDDEHSHADTAIGGVVGFSMGRVSYTYTTSKIALGTVSVESPAILNIAGIVGQHVGNAANSVHNNVSLVTQFTTEDTSDVAGTFNHAYIIGNDTGVDVLNSNFAIHDDAIDSGDTHNGVNGEEITSDVLHGTTFWKDMASGAGFCIDSADTAQTGTVSTPCASKLNPWWVNPAGGSLPVLHGFGPASGDNQGILADIGGQHTGLPSDLQAETAVPSGCSLIEDVHYSLTCNLTNFASTIAITFDSSTHNILINGADTGRKNTLGIVLYQDGTEYNFARNYTIVSVDGTNQLAGSQVRIGVNAYTRSFSSINSNNNTMFDNKNGANVIYDINTLEDGQMTLKNTTCENPLISALGSNTNVVINSLIVNYVQSVNESECSLPNKHYSAAVIGGGVNNTNSNYAVGNVTFNSYKFSGHGWEQGSTVFHLLNSATQLSQSDAAAIGGGANLGTGNYSVGNITINNLEGAKFWAVGLKVDNTASKATGAAIGGGLNFSEGSYSVGNIAIDNKGIFQANDIGNDNGIEGAQRESYGAAIGGGTQIVKGQNSNYSVSSITVKNTSTNAQIKPTYSGAAEGAGIGGGFNTYNRDGILTAADGSNIIAENSHYSVGNIKVSGECGSSFGHLNACGDMYISAGWEDTNSNAAGIGGGYNHVDGATYSVGDIAISGSVMLNASSGAMSNNDITRNIYGAGIGGGMNDASAKYLVSSISVSNVNETSAFSSLGYDNISSLLYNFEGQLSATSKGAAIGAGAQMGICNQVAHPSLCANSRYEVGDISITGGEVHAYSSLGSASPAYGAGIGLGEQRMPGTGPGEEHIAIPYTVNEINIANPDGKVFAGSAFSGNENVHPGYGAGIGGKGVKQVNISLGYTFAEQGSSIEDTESSYDLLADKIVVESGTLVPATVVKHGIKPAVQPVSVNDIPVFPLYIYDHSGTDIDYDEANYVHELGDIAVIMGANAPETGTPYVSHQYDNIINGVYEPITGNVHISAILWLEPGAYSDRTLKFTGSHFDYADFMHQYGAVGRNSRMFGTGTFSAIIACLIGFAFFLFGGISLCEQVLSSILGRDVHLGNWQAPPQDLPRYATLVEPYDCTYESCALSDELGSGRPPTLEELSATGLRPFNTAEYQTNAILWGKQLLLNSRNLPFTVLAGEDSLKVQFTKPQGYEGQFFTEYVVSIATVNSTNSYLFDDIDTQCENLGNDTYSCEVPNLAQGTYFVALKRINSSNTNNTILPFSPYTYQYPIIIGQDVIVPPDNPDSFENNASSEIQSIAETGVDAQLLLFALLAMLMLLGGAFVLRRQRQI